MTERLYYNDSKLLGFDATVVETGQYKDGFYTVLDRSAFYPTSGGQPHDLGVINAIDITNVVESEDGDIWHISKQPVGDSGQAVRGSIDGIRRKYHCQLHTAQHLLSGLFAAQHKHGTVSVHLGQEYGAIELSVETIPAPVLDSAETQINQQIQQNKMIEIVFAEGDELSALPVRRMPSRTGALRVIKIGDLDCTACGGTHCQQTGDIGLVKIIGAEKLRGNALVKFLAGPRAVADYVERFRATDILTRNLTCGVNDLPERIDKLSEDNKDIRKQIGQMLYELKPLHIDRLVGAAIKTGDCNFVVSEYEAPDSRITSQVAAGIADSINGVAALYTDGRLVIVVSEGFRVSAKTLAQKLSDSFGLKGGGSARQAQLGGADRLLLKKYEDAIAGYLANA